MFFFDSHGALHATCDANHPYAAAFGPTGVSREADPAEAGLRVSFGETPWSAASRAGRLSRGRDGGFDTLKPVSQ